MSSTHPITPATPANAFMFHVNLADDWERRFLADRLGVSEEALRASTDHDDVTVEEIFDAFCPAPATAHRSHAELHCERVMQQLASAKA
jgi:hypothetical protein